MPFGDVSIIDVQHIKSHRGALTSASDFSLRAAHKYSIAT